MVCAIYDLSLLCFLSRRFVRVIEHVVCVNLPVCFLFVCGGVAVVIVRARVCMCARSFVRLFVCLFVCFVRVTLLGGISFVVVYNLTRPMPSHMHILIRMLCLFFFVNVSHGHTHTHTHTHAHVRTFALFHYILQDRFGQTMRKIALLLFLLLSAVCAREVTKVELGTDNVKIITNTKHAAFKKNDQSLSGKCEFVYNEMQSSTTEVTTKAGASYAFGADITATTGDHLSDMLKPEFGGSFGLDLIFEKESGKVRVQNRGTSMDFAVACKQGTGYVLQVVQLKYEIELPMTYHFDDGTTAEAVWKGQVFSPGMFTQTLDVNDRSRAREQGIGRRYSIAVKRAEKIAVEKENLERLVEKLTAKRADVLTAEKTESMANLQRQIQDLAFKRQKAKIAVDKKDDPLDTGANDDTLYVAKPKVTKVELGTDNVKIITNTKHAAFKKNDQSLSGKCEFVYNEMQSSTTEVTTKAGASYAFGADITATTGDHLSDMLKPEFGGSFGLDLIFEKESGKVRVQNRGTSMDFAVACKQGTGYVLQVVQLKYEIELPMTYHFDDGTTAEAVWKGQVFSPGMFTQTLDISGQSNNQEQETGSSLLVKTRNDDTLFAEDTDNAVAAETNNTLSAGKHDGTVTKLLHASSQFIADKEEFLGEVDRYIEYLSFETGRLNRIVEKLLVNRKTVNVAAEKDGILTDGCDCDQACLLFAAEKKKTGELTNENEDVKQLNAVENKKYIETQTTDFTSASRKGGMHRVDDHTRVMIQNVGKKLYIIVLIYFIVRY